jgi:putative two-component system response regulator
MKQHTVIGWRMFHNSSSPLLKSVAQIAVSHHEKWDGTGYPHGTKGEDIPVYGRIIAIVDIFDALVSKRCYKDVWTVESAVAHIKSLSGTHLDPGLVQTFLKNEEQIRNIYQANLTIQQYISDFKDVKDKFE